LTFYWTFSNSLTLLQAAAIKNNTIKRLLHIPQPPPQPKLKNVEVEKPPTMIDSAYALRDFFSNRWTKAKENAEAHQRSANGASGRQAPKPRLAGLEQSEIIREAAPAFAAAEAVTPVVEALPSAGRPVAAAQAQPAAAPPKKTAAPVVRKLSPGQSEKEARVAAARLRRQRK
jgi:hypothetical protein